MEKLITAESAAHELLEVARQYAQRNVRLLFDILDRVAHRELPPALTLQRKVWDILNKIIPVAATYAEIDNIVAEIKTEFRSLTHYMES